MRIAYFSDDFYPMITGIGDTILITGKELSRRGHEVVYIAPRYAKATYEKTDRAYPADPAYELAEGLPVVRLPSFHIPFSPTGQSRFAIPNGSSFAFLKSFKPDVIHTQSPYGVGWEALRAARRFGVPLVGTNHTAVEDFFPAGTRGIMRKYDAWYYNHCDFVTAPYAKLLERMREKGFTKPGRAVANPAELELFTPATPAERAEHKRALGLTGPTLLYVGRLGVEKRVDVLIRALALLQKEFRTITLIATGHGAAEAGLKKLAVRLGVEKNMYFTGFLSREALSDVYKAADVFAFMSTSDSQSISLMQAYATGTPAVCARARGLPDYTPSEAGFLVEPGDHAALAEKLKLLLTDSALRERMGAAATDYVKKFSPEKIALEWEQIYRDAIARGLS
ncbi:hypothetical protein A3D70_00275 [Candidatus Adlerbacteria bacterium RIFCSPHIGHO2_02_FULL_54_18]|uniref:Glycosyl transferase family 1 n=2 Tax=Candidatus Adleribacteriota TaxID=1752736 RepID=A0A1F4Y4S2_9BACT|nr:MAG: hypothetical protein A2949_03040 [Candidatus Adlerbacteria bacterium RIFCSPLOWO2_01_FULL_54_21b]OGC88975.1 MAG: hypothetical protein A3D70_00275 [Candidatus Adlerbacteria bacterium RIFCSPHIGHO2_02_FULL_54_18]